MKVEWLIAALALTAHQEGAAQAPAEAQSLKGELTSTDARGPGGKFTDSFVLNGVAGARVTIELRQSAFDAVVTVEGPKGFRVEAVKSSASPRTFELRLPSSGQYRVLVTSKSAGATGAYQIAVRGFSSQSRQSAASSPRATRSITGSGAVVGRAYLAPGEEFVPAAGELPNGVVLLRRGDDAKNRSICNAFVNYIAAEEDIRSADAEAQIISTYWPLARIPGSLTNCDALLQSYDYARALTIRAKYGLASTSGPAFLAVQSATEYFALDLSQADETKVAEVTKSWFAVATSEGTAGTLSGEQATAADASGTPAAGNTASADAAATSTQAAPEEPAAVPAPEEAPASTVSGQTQLAPQATNAAPSAQGIAAQQRPGKAKGKQLFAMACKFGSLFGAAVPLVGTVSQAVCAK